MLARLALEKEESYAIWAESIDCLRTLLQIRFFIVDLAAGTLPSLGISGFVIASLLLHVPSWWHEGVVSSLAYMAGRRRHRHVRATGSQHLHVRRWQGTQVALSNACSRNWIDVFPFQKQPDNSFMSVESSPP